MVEIKDIKPDRRMCVQFGRMTRSVPRVGRTMTGTSAFSLIVNAYILKGIVDLGAVGWSFTGQSGQSDRHN